MADSGIAGACELNRVLASRLVGGFTNPATRRSADDRYPWESWL